MSTIIENKTWTIPEVLALPDDGCERWLIRGELRQHEEPAMTRRNRWHSQVLVAIATALKNWRDGLPQPRGQVLGGEAGCILQRDPETMVGIDVAYFGPDVTEADMGDTTLMDGAPLLAVEILSPSDTQRDIDEKVDAYLEAGVQLIWIVDPHLQTVLTIRPDAPPRLYNNIETIADERCLPGFDCPVSHFFE